MSKKNAIEKRLDVLAAQWSEFANDEQARLLRWLVNDDEVRMVDTLVAVQQSDAILVQGIFLKLSVPFGDPLDYASSLSEDLSRQYEEIRDGIREEGVASDWRVSPRNPKASDLRDLVTTLASFADYYRALAPHLAVVLAPIAIGSWPAWQEWLGDLLREKVPEAVRFIVLDRKAAPQLGALAESAPEVVSSVDADLDMSGAMVELVRDVPGNGPDVKFRRYFVALTNAAAANDLPRAERAAKSALKIAEQQGWMQMQFVVLVTQGATMLGAQEPEKAIAFYQKARAVAEGVAEDPASAKLVVQGYMGEAAVLFGENRFGEAALLYEVAAPLAAEQEDHFTEMECWRMAGYCHEQEEHYDRGWVCGNQALSAAENLEQSMRESSTLPFVGEGLLRIAKHGPYRREAEKVRKRMEELAGRDWEQRLPGGGSGA